MKTVIEIKMKERKNSAKLLKSRKQKAVTAVTLCVALLN